MSGLLARINIYLSLRRLGRPPRRLLWVWLAAVSIIFLSLLVWLMLGVCVGRMPQAIEDLLNGSKSCSTASGFPAAVVGAVVGWLATVGWIVQRYTAASIARKQHTMNVLMNMRNSELYNTHRVNARSHYRLDRPITDQQLDMLRDDRRSLTDGYAVHASSGRATYPPHDSAIYILNYMEFIAVAITRGDMDEEMVRVPLGATFVSYFRRFWPMLREDLFDSDPGRNFGDGIDDPDRSYAMLYYLVRRWGLTRESVDDFMRRWTTSPTLAARDRNVGAGYDARSAPPTTTGDSR